MSADDAHRTWLQSGCDQLGVAIGSGQIDKLLSYVQELAKWNAVYNLTSIRGIDQMLSLHLLDSLAVLPYVHGESLLDVGTGAGLPGLPLAIARPELRVCLLDSNGKKTRFLHQVVARLRLGNVRVVNCRVEEFEHEGGFSCVTSRAFSGLGEFVAHCKALCATDGEALAMLGKRPVESELSALGDRLLELAALRVPGLDAERHVARIAARSAQ